MIAQRPRTTHKAGFILLPLLISGISVVTLYTMPPSARTPPYVRQIYWIGLGALAYFSVLLVDYHKIARQAYLFYEIVLLLLGVVLFAGRVGHGARRWLSFGSLSFQPSEIAKVVLLLVMARYFSDILKERRSPPFLLPLFLVLVPTWLVLKQPDLGTAFALLLLFAIQALVAGMRLRFGGLVLLFLLLFSPFLLHLTWGGLQGYQRQRLVAFFDPSFDPGGINYHITQSKIAVGSGRFTGKGMSGATQSQLRFLPEAHTDFIFATFAEQWGFIGVSLLLLLYVFLTGWGIEVAWRAKDMLGCLIAAGIVGMIGLSVALNIGMALGILPVVGVPLPLMSYGGTSVVMTYAALGLLTNVRMRRFMLFY